jgi:voltage-gated potassium channel Kch
MLVTPVAFLVSERIGKRLKATTQPIYDEMKDEHNPVIIAGFGRFGQIVGRLLAVTGTPFTALEKDSSQVDVVRRFGNIVHYGDASKLELLRAAGAQHARLFVLAIDDVEASMKTAETVSRHFPSLTIVARARNRRHEYHLMDLGIRHIYRETLMSSLAMGEQVLIDLGETDARRIVETFREKDAELIRQQHAVQHDEEMVIQTARETARELELLLRNDKQ